MKNKIVAGLVCLAFILCPAWPTAGAASPVSIQSVEVNESGIIEATGYVQGAGPGDSATFLVIPEDTASASIRAEDIAYIDQIYLGNNGTFLFQFKLHEKWSGKSLKAVVGSSLGGQSAEKAFTAPKIISGIQSIENNSVIYGQDAYTMDSEFLEAEHVTDSIVFGGNVIYYKMGGHWYNLLDKRAVSNAFLTPANAVSESAMRTVTLRWYYFHNDKFMLTQ